MVNCSLMRFLMVTAALALGCSSGAYSTDDDCGEMGPVCYCNGEQVTGTCEGGVLSCDCPGGSGGDAGASGGDGSGGAGDSGGSYPAGGDGSGGDPIDGSGGEVSTGGADDYSGGAWGDGGEASGGAPEETGGTSSGGAASGGSDSGGSSSSGGSGSGGAVQAMCSVESGPCRGSGDRTYYCGGDPEDPTCKQCTPGWCNCSQGPTYEPGGVQDACEYNSFPGYTCSVVCEYCLADPEACP